jgi:glycerophosphoryl diester phosphodiesterase
LPVIWGHRGASADRPENTIAAFVEARVQGADGVELDVRRSADGGLVVHHDPRLPDGRPIASLAVRDLPEDVCLLDAALEACAANDLLVNVEIKNVDVDPDHDPTEYLAKAVVDLVNERRLHEAVLVSSFSLATIDRVAHLDPDIRTGYLASPRWDQAHALARAVEAGHRAFHPFDLAVNEGLVEAAHAKGVEVNVWTVDDPERIRWLAATGVDGIITNTPAAARRALEAT